MNRNYGEYDIHGFTADFYDVVYNHALSGKDIPFYIDYSRRSGGRTLELGCGTGRVLVPTAEAGCDITGLDVSDYMLNRCREALALRPEKVRQRVRLAHGTMTDFSTGEIYSLVTIPFRAFQHLVAVEEQRACLNCIREHLEPDGLLIIDIFSPKPSLLFNNPSATEEQESFPETRLPDGRTLRRTNRNTGFHREQQYTDCEITYYVTHPDSRQERLVQRFPMRFMFRHEMEFLLELSGFEVIELFGDFDRSPYGDDSPEIITVARKGG